MQLYRKPLTSLDELEREKIRLRYERKGTKVKHLLPDIKKARKKLTGKKSKAADGGNDLLKLAMGLISGGGSPMKLAMSAAGPALNLLLKSGKGGSSAPRRFLGKVVKDIAISYLIGKGVQLAMAGTKAYMRKRKTKQAMAKANAALAGR